MRSPGRISVAAGDSRRISSPWQKYSPFNGRLDQLPVSPADRFVKTLAKGGAASTVLSFLELVTEKSIS